MRKIVTPGGQIQEIRSGGTGTFPRMPAGSPPALPAPTAPGALQPPSGGNFPAPPNPWGAAAPAPALTDGTSSTTISLVAKGCGSYRLPCTSKLTKSPIKG